MIMLEIEHYQNNIIKIASDNKLNIQNISVSSKSPFQVATIISKSILDQVDHELFNNFRHNQSS